MGNMKDITGRRFGRWTVLSVAGKNSYGAYMWNCVCDCGTRRAVAGHTLRRGLSMSCGCLGAEHRLKAVRDKPKGKSNDRLYSVWSGMVDRCHNSASKYYDRYGGRGITVCAEWRDNYDAFKKWAYSNGYNDSVSKYQCTIDRIDNQLGYSPDNCRWVDMTVQCNNRASNHIIAFNGASHTLSEWARITGIRKDTLRRRLCVYKWPVERAMTEPVHR